LAIWLIAGIANVVSSHESAVSACSNGAGGIAQRVDQTCSNSYDIGAFVGVAPVLFFWVAGDVILGVLYMLRRRS
jgi:hypothetical protein